MVEPQGVPLSLFICIASKFHFETHNRDNGNANILFIAYFLQWVNFKNI